RRAALGLQAARATERETTAARATNAERDGAEPTRAEPSERADTPTRDAAPVHEPTMAELYAMATEARDPVKAIGLFDRVARSSDVRAELSAHQAARLVMRIGRCSEATERFAAMLTRWPASAYAEEARLDVLECQLRLGALDAAHRALEDFLAHHPASARSPEVLFLRAELYRSKGALDHAVADYRAALGSRRDADARYFLGWCALEAGRLDAAESALTDYLARYPDGRHAANARGGLAEVTRRRAEKK
ncbi:outer membrane protein assembly factor BamD, partial [Myxococcota bacterium]|nr:outer membrane protein assembly factor BamD [Myxococcota bacterium]